MSVLNNRPVSATLSNQTETVPKRYEAYGITLAIFALILLLRPYGGIRHDSILYLGQIFQVIMPETFGSDLFFAFGSQSQYTLFPKIFAPLVALWGAEDAFLYLTLFGRILFFLVSALLVWRLFPDVFRRPAILALITLPATYGSYSIFAYGEAFFTARTFAEPLALLALYGILTQRWWLALSCALAAFLLHPLQMVAMCLVIWIYLCLTDKRWLHLAWIGPLMTIPVYVFMPTADFIFNQYDPEWWSWIIEPNQHVFLAKWRFIDWAYVIVDLFLAMLLIRFSSGKLERLGISVLAATIVGFLFTLIFADMLRMVLPAAVQLWRAHWVLHWVVVCSVPWIVFKVYRQSGRDLVPPLVLLLTVISGSNYGSFSVPPWAVLILIPVFLLWEKTNQSVSRGFKRIFLYSLLAALVILVGKFVLSSVMFFVATGYSLEELRIDSILLSYPPIMIGICLLIIWMWQRNLFWIKGALSFTCVLLFAYSASAWDSRNTWTKALESSELSENIFSVELPQAAQVYWHEDLLAPWLILNRPSYYTHQQNAGLLFNRGTAEEAHLRSNLTEILAFQKELCQLMNNLNGREDSCLPDERTIAGMCDKSQGKLHSIVLQDRVNFPVAGTWQFSADKSKEEAVTYYLYQCSEILGYRESESPSAK